MADNTQLFLNEWLGKQIDVDHYPPNQPYQCKDPIQKYVTECLGNPPFPVGDAGDMYALAPIKLYIKIPNTLWNRTFNFREGDIPIWDKALNYDPKVGHGYGHISLKDKTKAGPLSFTSADQNWNQPRFVTIKHNYTHVIGWIRKR